MMGLGKWENGDGWMCAKGKGESKGSAASCVLVAAARSSRLDHHKQKQIPKHTHTHTNPLNQIKNTHTITHNTTRKTTQVRGGGSHGLPPPEGPPHPPPRHRRRPRHFPRRAAGSVKRASFMHDFNQYRLGIRGVYNQHTFTTSHTHAHMYTQKLTYLSFLCVWPLQASTPSTACTPRASGGTAARSSWRTTGASFLLPAVVVVAVWILLRPPIPPPSLYPISIYSQPYQSNDDNRAEEGAGSTPREHVDLTKARYVFFCLLFFCVGAC